MGIDPLSAAIEAAVARAFDECLPVIIAAVANAAPQPSTEDEDRFVRMDEAAKLLGKSPSTIWRLERYGKLPPRERLAGSVGYRLSTIRAILRAMESGPLPAPATAIKPGEKRGGRHRKVSDGEASP